MLPRTLITDTPYIDFATGLYLERAFFPDEVLVIRITWLWFFIPTNIPPSDRACKSNAACKFLKKKESRRKLS